MKVLRKHNEYAKREDFRNLFINNLDCLYQLALLLTGDRDKAQSTFMAGLEDSIQSKFVFKEWAYSWAKRAIIQNAIHLVRPNEQREASPLTASCSASPALVKDLAHAEGLLHLSAFERCVFVMSVLERYSDRECALLLRCSDREVREARISALTTIANEQKSAAALNTCRITHAALRENQQRVPVPGDELAFGGEAQE
jgi:DNA-directed RNA polymerase specialized sigma24 family protein